MAMLSFTKEQKLGLLNPFASGDTTIELEYGDCIGGGCGERIFLSQEDQEKYGCPTSQKPMGPHCHIVVRGRNPDAGPGATPCFQNKQTKIANRVITRDA